MAYRRWTPDTIIAAVQCFYAQRQRVPKWCEFDGAYGLPFDSTVRHHFPSYHAVLRAAGYETPVPALRKRHAWQGAKPTPMKGNG